jgi:hypothetical protein
MASLCAACVALVPEGPHIPPTPLRGPSSFATDDLVYVPAVRTVQLIQDGQQGLPPVLFLDGPAQLSLEFDELMPYEAEPGNYVLDILACDLDWRQTGDLPLSFYSGFQRAQVEMVGRSWRTRMPYAHYAVRVPADGAAFKRSGNYLLRVSAPQDSNRVILTRRLVVAEQSAVIQGGLRAATMLADRKRKQRLDFDVLLTGDVAQGYDPLQDVQATILRNFRWQDAVTGIRPQFVEGSRLQFFVPAGEELDPGNEYRRLDLSQGFPSTALVAGLPGADSLFAVEPPLDQPRLPGRRAALQDQNGGFHIGAYNVGDPGLSADYRLVQFSLAAPKPKAGYQLYVTGGFVDWRCEEENLMSYDPAHYRYTTAILLKEGVYDYAYMAVDAAGHWDEAMMEGAHSETENVYTVLLYLNAPGLGSPRLIGIQQFF